MNKTLFVKDGVKNCDFFVDQVYKLRHETFVNRLGWDVKSEQGREKDQFDGLNAFHIAIIDTEVKNILGCWRALPTTEDYMLKSVFPQLLQGERAPEEEGVWEISRFTVKKGKVERGKGSFASVTLALVKSFYGFAIENDIKYYVTVTTVACERLLRQLGINMRRMGGAKSMQIGIERSVALLIEVDEALNLNVVTH